MDGTIASVACESKLAFLEHAVEDLRAAQKLQGEALLHEISKLQLNNGAGSSPIRASSSPIAGHGNGASELRRMEERLQMCEKVQDHITKALTDLASSSDTKLALTPTIDQGDTSSALRQSEERLQVCEKVQKRLAMSLAAASDNFATFSALKAIEERLEKLEQLREDVAPQNDALVGDKKLSEASGEIVRQISPVNMIGVRSISETNLGTPEAQGTYRIWDQMALADAGSRKVEFNGSLYDAAFFVGSKYVPPYSTVIVTVAFGLNMVMQLGVVFILGSEQFLKNEFSDDGFHGYRRWRYSEGHSVRNADEILGTSLAARVCKGDRAMAFASRQMKILDQAEDYLDGGKGVFLRTIAVVLWYFCCAQELTKALLFMIATFRTPRTIGFRDVGKKGWVGHTEFRSEGHEVRVISLSLFRVLVGFCLAACRILIATLLLYHGAQWLTLTSSTLDLLLNASALSFVLDIDETIYGAVAPLNVKNLISSAHPLKIPADKKMALIPMIIIVACIVGTSLNNFFGDMFIKNMDNVKDILCSNNETINFVLGTNALGWVTFAESAPFPLSASHDWTWKLMRVREDVTRSIIDGNPKAHRYFLNMSKGPTFRNVAALKEMAVMTLVDLTKTNPCVDLPWNPGAVSDAKLGGLLWSALGQEQFKDVTMCSEVKHHCYRRKTSRIGQNVRFMCPITCGCASAKSGLWDLFHAEAGCPETNCVHKFIEDSTKNHHYCKDANVEYLKATNSWNFMVQRMYKYEAINNSVFQNLTKMGCMALRFLSASQRDELCQSQRPYLFHGAGFMCPISCGCLPDPDDAQSTFVDKPGLCPNTDCKIKYLQALQELGGKSENASKESEGE